MPRIRTIGGVGGGGSTSTAAITAANVEWGPNFGSTRELAQEAQMFSSYFAGTTRLLTVDELVRLYTQQGTWKAIQESSVRVDNLLLFPVPPMLEEEVLTRTNIAMTSRQFIEEEQITSYSHSPGYKLNSEGVLRTSNWNLTYPNALEHEEALTRTNVGESLRSFSEEEVLAKTNVAEDSRSVITDEMLRLSTFDANYPMIEDVVGRLVELLYENYRPATEGAITGSCEAAFFDSGEWTVPDGVTTYTAFGWGGGGGGGNGGAVSGGSGGGGGAFSITTGMTGTSMTTVTISISVATTGNGGDMSVGTTTMLLARGGIRGGNNAAAAGAGGSSATGVGTAKYGGGAGRANSGNQGGGGGGGAGTTTNGEGGGTSTAGGAGGSQFGGNGGDGGNNLEVGAAGGVRGGGGGGGGAGLSSGGISGRGQANIIFPLV